MSWLSSQRLTLGIVVLLVVACVVAEPMTDTFPQGSSDWNAPPGSPLTVRRNELEAARQATATRLALKARLLEELAAGRMTLVQVANYFAEVDAECPAYEDAHRNARGHTAAERVARNVYERLCIHPIASVHRAAILARVRHEFEGHFGYPLD